jgi:hypothetical protein
MTCGIYKIEANCPIAKLTGIAIYIGQSKNIEKRWKTHQKKYPTNQYNYEILLKCDVEYLDFFEKAFISGYDSHRFGLNKTIGGTSIKATHPDKETRKKLSKNNARYHLGKKHSAEHKQKISDAHKGKKLSEKALQNVKEINCKKVQINGIEYNSLKLAAEALGIKRTTLGAYLSGQNNWPKGLSGKYI